MSAGRSLTARWDAKPGSSSGSASNKRRSVQGIGKAASPAGGKSLTDRFQQGPSSRPLSPTPALSDEAASTPRALSPVPAKSLAAAAAAAASTVAPLNITKRLDSSAELADARTLSTSLTASKSIAPPAEAQPAAQPFDLTAKPTAQPASGTAAAVTPAVAASATASEQVAPSTTPPPASSAASAPEPPSTPPAEAVKVAEPPKAERAASPANAKPSVAPAVVPASAPTNGSAVAGPASAAGSSAEDEDEWEDDDGEEEEEEEEDEEEEEGGEEDEEGEEEAETEESEAAEEAEEEDEDNEDDWEDESEEAAAVAPQTSASAPDQAPAPVSASATAPSSTRAQSAAPAVAAAATSAAASAAALKAAESAAPKAIASPAAASAAAPGSSQPEAQQKAAAQPAPAVQSAPSLPPAADLKLAQPASERPAAPAAAASAALPEAEADASESEDGQAEEFASEQDEEEEEEEAASGDDDDDDVEEEEEEEDDEGEEQDEEETAESEAVETEDEEFDQAQSFEETAESPELEPQPRLPAQPAAPETATAAAAAAGVAATAGASAAAPKASVEGAAPVVAAAPLAAPAQAPPADAARRASPIAPVASLPAVRDADPLPSATFAQAPASPAQSFRSAKLPASTASFAASSPGRGPPSPAHSFKSIESPNLRSIDSPSQFSDADNPLARAEQARAADDGGADDEASAFSHFSIASSVASSTAETEESAFPGFNLNAGDKPTLGASGALFEDLPKPLYSQRQPAPSAAQILAASASAQPATQPPAEKSAQQAEKQGSRAAPAGDSGSDGHSDAGTEVGTLESFHDDEVDEDPFAIPATASREASAAAKAPTVSRLFEREYVSPNVDYAQKKQRPIPVIAKARESGSTSRPGSSGSGAASSPRVAADPLASPSPDKSPAAALRAHHRKTSSASSRGAKFSGFDQVLENATRDKSASPEHDGPEDFADAETFSQAHSDAGATPAPSKGHSSEDHRQSSGFATPTNGAGSPVQPPSAFADRKMSWSGGSSQGSDHSRRASIEAALRAGMASPPPGRPPRHAARPPPVIEAPSSPQGSILSLIKGDGATPEPSESEFTADGSEEEREIWRGMDVNVGSTSDQHNASPPQPSASKTLEEQEVERQRAELASWEAEIVRQTEELNKRKEEARKRQPSVMWADQLDGNAGGTKKRTAGSSPSFNPMAAPQAQPAGSSVLPNGMPKPIIASPPPAAVATRTQPTPVLEDPSEDFNPQARTPLLLSTSPPLQSPTSNGGLWGQREISKERFDSPKERLESAIALLPPRSSPDTPPSMQMQRSSSGARSSSGTNTPPANPPSAEGMKRTDSVDSRASKRLTGGFVDYGVKRGSARAQALAEGDSDDEAREAVPSLGVERHGASGSGASASLRRQPSTPEARRSFQGEQVLTRHSSLSNMGVLDPPTRRTSLHLSSPPPNEPLPPRPPSTHLSPSRSSVLFEDRAKSPPVASGSVSMQPISSAQTQTPSKPAQKSFNESIFGMPTMSTAMSMQMAEQYSDSGSYTQPFATSFADDRRRSSSASVRSSGSQGSRDEPRRSMQSVAGSFKAPKDSAPANPKASKSSILASMIGTSRVISGSSDAKGRNRAQRTSSISSPMLQQLSNDDNSSIRSRASVATGASRRQQSASAFDSPARSSTISLQPSTGATSPAATVPEPPQYPSKRRNSLSQGQLTPSSATSPAAVNVEPPVYPTKRRDSLDQGMQPAIGQVDADVDRSSIQEQAPRASRASSIRSSEAASIATEPSDESEQAQSSAVRALAESTAPSRRSRRGFVKDDAPVVETIREEEPDADGSTLKLKTLRKRKIELDEWVSESSWDDLLVIRYLHMFGKNIRRARALKVLDPAEIEGSAFPEANDWKHTDQNGRTSFNRVGYYLACLTAFASAIFSSSPDRLDRPEVTSSNAASLIAANTSDSLTGEDTHERLYITALPIYRGVVSGVHDLALWRRKGRTLFAMISYFALWHFNLLLHAALVVPMLWLLKMRDHPPAPELLRQSMLTKAHRSLQAKRAAIISEDKPKQNAKDDREQDHRPSAAEVWADEVAAVHERVKNLALWRSPPSTLRVFSWLAVSLILLLVVDHSVITRFAGLAFGVWFFFLLGLWRRFPWLCPVPGLSSNLTGTPDDDESAMEVIRRRASAGKPVLDNAIMLLTLRRLEDEDFAVANDGQYRAILGSQKGSLVISPHRVSFLTAEASERSEDVRLERIVALAKIDTVDELISGSEDVDFDALGKRPIRGLQLEVKGRKEPLTFLAVQNRDEAFNRLLAVSPILWQAA